MKPVDKKDMPKLIALIGLTVCSLGYGIYTLTAGSSYGNAAPPAPKQQEEKKSDPQKVGAAPEPTDGEGDALLSRLKALEQVSEPVLARDPFIASTLPDGTGAPAPAPKAPIAPPAGPPKTIAGVRKNLPNLGDLLRVNPKLGPESAPSTINTITGGTPPLGDAAPGSSTPGPTGPVVLPAPTPPAVEVSGVMIAESEGLKNIALLRIENNTRWVSVGDRVGKNYIVHSIRRTERGSEVEIIDTQDAKRRYTFKVN